MQSASLKGIVADDDQAVLWFVIAALADADYDLLPASNGAEALGLIEQQDGNVSFLISDMDMPNMDGTELARVVRSQFPTIAVVLMSGEYMPEEAQGLAHAVLKKPFAGTALRQAVDNALKQIRECS